MIKYDTQELRQVGGKAQNLRLLQQFGAPVPPFAVLGSDWSNRYLLEMNVLPLLTRFDNLAEDHVRAEMDNGESVSAAAEIQAMAVKAVKVSESFENGILGKLPPSAQNELAMAARQVRERAGRLVTPLAVRSSASVEDSEAAAFPGQFESRCGVIEQQELVAAAEICLASLLSKRSCSYRLRLRMEEVLRNLYGYPIRIQEWRTVIGPRRRTVPSPYEVERALVDTRGKAGTASASNLALVIQEMAVAQAAGVAFFPGPEPGQEDLVVVQGTLGLGESLVDSHVTPDSWLLDARGSLRSRTLGLKKTKVVPVSGGVRRVTCSADEQDAWCVGDDVARDIGAWARRLRDSFGWPGIDLEWVYDGRVVVVQSRPQTGLSSKLVLTVATDVATAVKPWYSGGQTASLGAVHGKLAVAERPDQAPNFPAILVVPATEKNWEDSGALFNALGVIAELGGQLSHSAIYGREANLPCVVGADGAIAAVRSKSGEIVTLDATRPAVYPGALPLEERLVRWGTHQDDGAAEGFADLERRGWGAVVEGRNCLIRVRPPFGCRFVVDCYVRGFRELDARFGTTHELLVTPDGGIYSPLGVPTALGAALAGLTLDEVEQLLRERQSAAEVFLALSFATANRFDALAWSSAHTKLVMFQHLSAALAKNFDRRLDRALATLDPAAKARVLGACSWTEPSETAKCRQEMQSLVSTASLLPELGRFEDSGAALEFLRTAHPAFFAELEHHAIWYRHGSADPSLPVPTDAVIRKLLRALKQEQHVPKLSGISHPDHEPDVDDGVSKLLRLTAWQAHIRESEHHQKARGLRRATQTMTSLAPQLSPVEFHSLKLDELVSRLDGGAGAHRRSCFQTNDQERTHVHDR